MNFKASRTQLIGTLLAFALGAGIATLALSSGAEPAEAATGKPVAISFTKWLVNADGLMAGSVDGGGTFAGQVLSYVPIPNTDIVKIEARYGVIDGASPFTARVFVTNNTRTGKAVLNGVVTEGALEGAHVHGGYNTLADCDGSPGDGDCFAVTLRIMPGSAN